MDEETREQMEKVLSAASGMIAEERGKHRAIGVVLVSFLLHDVIDTCVKRLELALPGLSNETDYESLRAAQEIFEPFGLWIREWLSSALKLAGARDEAASAELQERAVYLIRRYLSEDSKKEDAIALDKPTDSPSDGVHKNRRLEQ